MLVIHGHKRVRKRRGMVGAFCPICREPTRHCALCVGPVPEICHLSIWFMKPELTELVCEQCGSVFPADLDVCDRVKGSRVARDMEPLRLARETLPYSEEVLVHQMEIERSRRNGTISEQHRDMLWLVPFESLNHMTLQYALRPVGSPWSIAAGLLSMVSLVLAVGLSYRVSTIKPPPVWMVLGMVAAWMALIAGVAWAGWLYQNTMEIVVRRHILPRLAIAMSKINPTREDVERHVSAMRQAQQFVAQHVVIDELWNEIERVRAKTG